MKLKVFIAFFVFVMSASAAFAQNGAPTPTPTRNRVVESDKTLAPTPSKIVVITNTLPSPSPTPFPTPKITSMPIQNPIPVDNLNAPIKTAPIQPTFYKPLSFPEIKSKIAEAKRQMAARPMATALTDSFLTTEIVRLAFYDYKAAKIDYLVMTKDAFLSKNSGDFTLSTSNGNLVTVRNIRANGVNTPVLIIDSENKAHLPLLVQYPVERNGEYLETAYYISTHPGIVTPEVVSAGKLYVRNTIDLARENLRKKGVFVSPQVTDMAERLAIVEHVDHYRFKTEYHPNIYNDIFALYALNEGQTYRYSVSSAGAGGMVQMIPSTYRMIRSRYYAVNLMPDFVEGMRDHVNAAEAMLLYMQMTWDDLISNDIVYNAISDGVATPAELMSAGYNSNPARLAGYIKRGGSNWRNLIPRETQIYLQINASLDKFVPLSPRTK